MNIQESIKLLKEHNEWRRGAETEMHNPKDVGQAIDTLIDAVELLLEHRALRRMHDILDSFQSNAKD